jgi:hypothetical protein
MEIKKLQVSIDKETAFQLMDCRNDNPLYEELENLYEEMKKELKTFIEPKILLGFSDAADIFGDRSAWDGEEFAIVLCTLGDNISEHVSALFESGEYLKGTLADAMADSCLFSVEEEWKEILRKECRMRKRGIAKRMEAPGDFPTKYHKRLWEFLEGEKMGVSLTSGYMFEPVKTCGYLFLLSKDCSDYNADHDCSRCENRKCVLRNRNNKTT